MNAPPSKRPKLSITSSRSNDDEDFGLSEEAARRQIAGLLQNCYRADGHRRVMSLLRKFPSLAARKYWYQYHGRDHVYPLVYLLRCRAPISIAALREMCQLYPAAMTSFDADTLHKARFFSSAPNPAIQFVLEVCPHVATQCCVKRYYPIHMLLQRQRIDHVTIRKLLDAYPRAILKDPNCIALAIANGYSMACFELLVDRWAAAVSRVKNRKKAQSSLVVKKGSYLCLAKAELLAEKILPWLTSVVFAGLESYALFRILESLKTSRSITEVSLGHVRLTGPRDTETNQSRRQQLEQALERLLVENATIRRLTLDMGQFNTSFLALFNTRRQSRICRLDSLEITSNEAVSARILSTWLQEAIRLPRHLRLHIGSLSGRWHEDSLNNHRAAAQSETSGLRDLTIVVMRPSRAFPGLLSYLQTQQPLERLTLRLPLSSEESDALTETIVVLLRRDRLKSLDCCFGPIDPARFGMALRENTSLKELTISTGSTCDLSCAVADALTHHNTTLQEVDCEGSASDKIDYYSHLNQYGRREARNNGTNREEFVSLLCRVTEARRQSLQGDVVRVTGSEETDLLFGLLLESPVGTWC
ncbi:expressed unknown protein [Seminavis robusta]|uniref:Uncharacterized protein n=1 Tax=Seminavis robusta TaxID=568900 RepID=A0A9N8HEC0_9STRA|nr:expressed unknown protein [Seminavis robusta]|eukprot:Sro298_g111000.1 n/a (589) ;mRNA; r:5992-7758